MQNMILAQDAVLHIHPTDKFKDVTLCLELMDPLKKEEQAGRMVLAFMLQDVCRRYPTKKEAGKALDMLYGADITVNSDARGNASIFEIRITAADKRFIEDSDILQKQFELMHDFVFDPNMKDGHFQKALFEECRLKAITVVRMSNDDPSSYAVQRAAKVYGETIAARCLPDESDLAALKEEDVLFLYSNILSGSAADLFVLGHVDPDECMALAEKYIPLKDRFAKHQLINPSDRSVLTRKTEDKQITQSYLVNMYDTGHTYLDSEMPAMMLGNGILGALPTSFLFQEVREKRSLCYAISSENLVYDGILRIATAMNAENVELTQKLIEEQLQKMKDGSFSDEMMETSRRMYINSWRSSLDHVKSILWDDYRGIILNQDDAVADMIERFQKVTREQIAQAFSSIQLKTSYLLRQEDAE